MDPLSPGIQFLTTGGRVKPPVVPPEAVLRPRGAHESPLDGVLASPLTTGALPATAGRRGGL